MAQQRSIQVAGTPTNGQIARYNATTKTWDLVTLTASASGYGTYASRAGLSPSIGDMFTASENGAQFIYTGSIWKPFVDDSVGVEPPDVSGWTWRNQNASTMVNQYGRIDLQATATAGGTQFRGKTTAMPAPTTGKVRAYCKMSRGGAQTLALGGRGVALLESSTGKVCVAAMLAQTINANFTGYVFTLIYFTGNGSTAVSSSDYICPSDSNWIGIEVSGSNIIGTTSNDGRVWNTYASIAKTTPFTTAPDEYGVGAVLYSGMLADVQFRSLDLQ